MAVSKGLVVLVLLFTIVAMSLQYPGGAEAGAVSLKHGNSKKFFATLGLECKCCDGDKGECRSSWESSCSKLQCHPWKSYPIH
ncbi:hypothetical protein JCGZ_01360 [Jatropha curcas]|uniref:Uncharacterized protein n=1 Tax=Jatropha curcas TaxID=180498 RepID=A0A067LJM0_JATCU|nr:hypothetical protein JCGZ_01360 [Jatropha curcas]